MTDPITEESVKEWLDKRAAYTKKLEADAKLGALMQEALWTWFRTMGRTELEAVVATATDRLSRMKKDGE